MISSQTAPLAKDPSLESLARNRFGMSPCEGEGFLSSVFASIQDGITVLDAQLTILKINPTMERWYPRARPLVGEKCYQAYFGLSLPCRPCPAHRALMTGRPHLEVMARRGKTGKATAWFKVYSFPWRNHPDGKINGVINYSRDITYRLQVEEESLRRVEKTLHGTVSALAAVLEKRDPYTAGHQQRVVKIACALAQQLGLPQVQIDGLKVMGFLHDIGKMAVPAEILCKPSKLSEYEFNIVKAHPQVAYEILKEIEFPWPVARAVCQHHERLNGSGYPGGLYEQDIILEAKILAVADVVEAIASHRPYRPALGLGEALREISENAGVLYDLQVAKACQALFKKGDFAFD